MPAVFKAMQDLTTIQGGRSVENQRVVSRLVRKVSELKEYDPAQYEQQRQSLEISALAQLADIEAEARAARARGVLRGPKREQLTSELKASLKRAFDLKEQVKAHEAELIERELKAIRALLAQRKRNRDQIIGRRLLQLLDEDELAW